MIIRNTRIIKDEKEVKKFRDYRQKAKNEEMKL